ncbi:MAG: hypothetical protein AB7P04_12690 [Bacteriovoracia bacterium]
MDHAVQLTFGVILVTRLADLLLAFRIRESKPRLFLVFISLVMAAAPFYDEFAGTVFAVPSILLLARRWDRSRGGSVCGMSLGLIAAGLIAMMLGPNPYGFALYSGLGLVVTGVIGGIDCVIMRLRSAKR